MKEVITSNNTKMKVSIITCYESNEELVSFVFNACKERGYEVNAITSDYSHIRKEKRNNISEDFIAVDTKPYKKNLSIERLLSHKKFAKDAFKLVEKQNPDLIWLFAPANSLIEEANNYKRKHSDVKIVVHIIDMWPESLPVSFDKNLLPFKIWRNIRKNNINCADALVTECDFYQDILGKEYNDKITTIHWARDNTAKEYKLDLPEDKLSLIYIGSINNIIAPEIMNDIISKIDKPVVMHVIGEGENTDNFIDTLSKTCEVIYHGVVRDEEKKAKIFSRCHAGMNIYKEGLYIGLTVKCIDYFEHGLPIINNIKGDTWSFVDKEKVGFNVDSNTKLNSQEIIDMRMNNKHIYELFRNNFTKEVFEKKCLEVIDEVMQ